MKCLKFRLNLDDISGKSIMINRGRKVLRMGRLMGLTLKQIFRTVTHFPGSHRLRISRALYAWERGRVNFSSSKGAGKITLTNSLIKDCENSHILYEAKLLEEKRQKKHTAGNEKKA